MPHNLSTQIALYISKILIGGTASLSGLGIYSVASQFGNIADTVQCYVDSAYGPWLYEKLHERDVKYKETIRDAVQMLISVIGLVFVGIALFSHDYIILFVNKEYVTSWIYVPMIVSVYAIKTAYYFFVEVLFYYKKASQKLFYATLSSSIVNVFLSAFMIPVWGIVGSILADAISMIIRVLIVIAISKQYEDVGLKVKDFVKNFIIVELFILAGLSLSYIKYPQTFNWNNLLFKITIVLLYLVYVYVVNKKQINAVLRSLKTKIKHVSNV